MICVTCVPLLAEKCLKDCCYCTHFLLLNIIQMHIFKYGAGNWGIKLREQIFTFRIFQLKKSEIWEIWIWVLYDCKKVEHSLVIATCVLKVFKPTILELNTKVGLLKFISDLNYYQFLDLLCFTQWKLILSDQRQ